MPHTLRSVELDDETLAELSVLSGFDDDLAGQIPATSNRVCGLLTQIHPALERALGPHLDRPATRPPPAHLGILGAQASGRNPVRGTPHRPVWNILGRRKRRAGCKKRAIRRRSESVRKKRSILIIESTPLEW